MIEKDTQHNHGYIHGIEDYLNLLCNDAFFYFGKDIGTLKIEDLEENANAVINDKIKRANELDRIKEMGFFEVRTIEANINRPNPYIIQFKYTPQK